jgi:hypothetical protein
MSTVELQHHRATDEQVRRWRYSQLRRAGCDRRTARRLAERREVDLHRAIDLLEQGCPPAVASQILL